METASSSTREAAFAASATFAAFASESNVFTAFAEEANKYFVANCYLLANLRVPNCTAESTFRLVVAGGRWRSCTAACTGKAAAENAAHSC